MTILSLPFISFKKYILQPIITRISKIFGIIDPEFDTTWVAHLDVACLKGFRMVYMKRPYSFRVSDADYFLLEVRNMCLCMCNCITPQIQGAYFMSPWNKLIHLTGPAICVTSCNLHAWVIFEGVNKNVEVFKKKLLSIRKKV